MQGMQSVDLSDESENDIIAPLAEGRTESSNNVLEFQFQFGNEQSPTDVKKLPTLKKK